MRMHESSNPITRATLAHTALLAIVALAVLCAPQGAVSLQGINVPYVLPFGALAIGLIYPVLACFCTHTVRQHVLLLDAGLKERFDRAARDSICLFDQRRSAARRDLRQITVDTVLAVKQVHDLQGGLLLAGLIAITVPLGVLLRQTPASVMVALLFCEAGALLLRCRSQIGREFPNPGPTQADYERLDREVEMFELLHKDLLLGLPLRKRFPAFVTNTSEEGATGLRLAA